MQSILPGVSVCGQGFFSTTAAVPASATENLCESSNDAKFSNTSKAQLDLIQECTAAALNLKSSDRNPGGLEACGPEVVNAFTACCGQLCGMGLSSELIDESSCIPILHTFNSLGGGTLSDVGLTNSPAQNSQCKAANGNGLTNCSSSLGGTINCGPANRHPENGLCYMFKDVT